MKTSSTRLARRFQASSQWDSIVSKASRQIQEIERSVAPAIKKIEEARDRALEKEFAKLLAESFKEEAGVTPTIRKLDIWEQEADYASYMEFRCDVELEVPSAVVNRDGEIDVVTEDEIKSAMGDWTYSKSPQIQVGKRVTKVKIDDARIHI